MVRARAEIMSSASQPTLSGLAFHLSLPLSLSISVSVPPSPCVSVCLSIAVSLSVSRLCLPLCLSPFLSPPPPKKKLRPTILVAQTDESRLCQNPQKREGGHH